MSRVVGLDPGSKRIGVAVSDSERSTAVPVAVVEVIRERPATLRQLATLIREYEATEVVVGLPTSLDGVERAAAVQARTLGRQLAELTGLPVGHHDERLTTVTADRLLAEAGHDSRSRRKVVDQVAAAVMLQSWLDRHRSDLPDPADARPSVSR